MTNEIHPASFTNTELDREQESSCSVCRCEGADPVSEKRLNDQAAAAAALGKAFVAAGFVVIGLGYLLFVITVL